MPALTTAQIKNYVRRAFREIVDPSPDKFIVPQIWEYFNCECAYCGKPLVKLNKDGHIDHLVSASKSGKNHISNRVLSCATCNEKEKLAQDWNDFLAKKCTNQEVHAARKSKIEKWILLHSETGSLRYNEEHVSLARKYADEVNLVFEKCVKELRAAVYPVSEASSIAAPSRVDVRGLNSNKKWNLNLKSAWNTTRVSESKKTLRWSLVLRS